jgi:hypothetical protein
MPHRNAGLVGCQLHIEDIACEPSIATAGAWQKALGPACGVGGIKEQLAHDGHQ